jgi:hypothetical protein
MSAINEFHRGRVLPDSSSAQKRQTPSLVVTLAGTTHRLDLVALEGDSNCANREDCGSPKTFSAQKLRSTSP